MIKALGGLNAETRVKTEENSDNFNDGSFGNTQTAEQTKTEIYSQKKELPNLMAEAILRHEQISNRIKRK